MRDWFFHLVTTVLGTATVVGSVGTPVQLCSSTPHYIAGNTPEEEPVCSSVVRGGIACPVQLCQSALEEMR